MTFKEEYENPSPLVGLLLLVVVYWLYPYLLHLLTLMGVPYTLLYLLERKLLSCSHCQ